MELKEIKELNRVASLVIDLWESNLIDDYRLYIDTHNIHNLPEGVMYGRDYLLNPASEVLLSDIPPLSNTKETLSNASTGYVSKIALFNKEEFYYYWVCYRNNEVIISLGISSMIWGKSKVHIADIRRIGEHKWELVAGRHSRTRSYNGYVGNIYECLSLILNEEERLESPYEQMKQCYPDDYSEAMAKKLDVTIAKGGYITINNWVGI